MKKYRSWVEVDRKALLSNFSVFRKNTKKKTKIVAVVKSNAYGHGIIEVAKILNSRADFFGVDDFSEALELSKAGIKKPILVFGYTLPLRYIEVAGKNVSITISSINQLRNLAFASQKFRSKIKIHLKVDTGLHRQGILPNEINTALKLIKNSNIELEGVYSHFASAENPNSPKDIKFCEKQISIFKKIIERVKAEKFKPITHMSGSAATFLLKDAEFDMVRAGLSLYGLWPSKETKEKLGFKFSLKPALSWKSIISEVKSVKVGDYVGYDLTERLEKDSKLAIIPVGYWHGYSRSLSNKAFVLVKGKRAKVCGRVSMDMIIVDVTGISGVREGDEVVLLGRQGKEEVSAEELAQIAGTINYEIVTQINPLQPRKVL